MHMFANSIATQLYYVYQTPRLQESRVTSPTKAQPNAAALRQTMVDSQLRTVGVIDADVLGAMASVPRERFVPAALGGLAYGDASLEVAPGRWLLEPMALALLLEHSGLQPGDRLLVVGAATGYSAAVAAHMGAKVTALESDADLAEPARSLPGVTLAIGPLAAGWPAGAPYDVILFEGAIEVLPSALAAQLAPGGRVAAIVRKNGVGHAHAGSVSTVAGVPSIGGRAFIEVAARPLPGFGRAPAFAF